MPGPIETVIERLAAHHLRPAGRNRWRARCPAHGGKNRNTLSIGIGDDDAVLLRCWHGCEVDSIAQALGLELADLFPPRLEAGQGASKPRRVGMLTAGQALDLIRAECNLIWVAAHNLANGLTLTPDDLERLNIAAARVENLVLEYHQ